MVVALFVSAQAALAQDRFDALRNDPEIHEGLLAISIGRLVRNHCDTIDARVFRAWAFAQTLVDRGISLGYSRAELEDYLESDADKDRYRRLARAYLGARGAVVEDAQSMCRLGRDEISSQSAVGRLLIEG
ncbi:DUF5333 domain-containing protein [Rhodobacteraceae bacterium XHP0102]|nr:DUF5333 domain-containing protein [Rhodobacteraceae bacterium XHP0102]